MTPLDKTLMIKNGKEMLLEFYFMCLNLSDS